MSYKEQIKILTQVLISQDLKTKQNEFLKSNCAKFTSDEENKLEYTAIHNSYVELMENLIIEEAKSKGTPIDIEMITDTFEKDPKSAADSHVIETLYTIIDFVKFKEIMLAYKEGSVDKHEVSLENVKLADIPRIKAALAVDGKELLYFKDSETWEVHTKISEDRILYRAKDTAAINSKLKTFKIEGKPWKFMCVFKNIKMENITRFFCNMPLFKKGVMDDETMKVMMIESFESIVSKPNDYQIVYAVNNIPMLSKRDNCIIECIHSADVDGVPTTFVTQKSINYEGYEASKDGKVIRMQQLSVVALSQVNGTDIKIEAVQEIKMGGWFPDYMLSYFMSWTMNTNIDKMEEMYRKMNDFKEE